MFNISQYLQKFKNVGLAEIAHKDAVIKVLEKVAGIKTVRASIDVKEGIIRIKNLNPLVRNHLILKKQKVLEALKTETTKNFKDIL